MSRSKMSELPELAGCSLLPLDSMACEQYLAWILGEPGTGTPADTAGLLWVLAHCDDGVTWGRHDAQAGAWHLASEVASEVSPPIRRDTIQELRLFGEPGEMLIWRTGTGLRGRALRDIEAAVDDRDESNPLRSSDESRIIRGEHVIAHYQLSFTHVGDRRGAQQVLPLAITESQLQHAQVRLEVRHYYEQNSETGAVRGAATRLVRINPGGTHGA